MVAALILIQYVSFRTQSVQLLTKWVAQCHVDREGCGKRAGSQSAFFFAPQRVCRDVGANFSNFAYFSSSCSFVDLYVALFSSLLGVFLL